MKVPLWTLTRDDFDRLAWLYRQYEANGGGGGRVSNLPVRQYAKDARYYEQIGLAKIAQYPPRPGDDGLRIYLTPLGVEIGKTIVHSDRRLAEIVQDVADNFVPPEEPDEEDVQVEITDPVLRAAAEAFAAEYVATRDGAAATAASVAAAQAAMGAAEVGLYSCNEAEKLTGIAASTWRNRCAAGKVPGAIKKGKTWLIPLPLTVAG